MAGSWGSFGPGKEGPRRRGRACRLRDPALDGSVYIGKTVWSEFNKYDVFGIKRSTDFTSRDRGHVEEIKRRLHKVERDYDLTLTEEKNWLDNLAERSYK